MTEPTPSDPLVLLKSIPGDDFPLLNHMLSKPGADELRGEVARLMAASIATGMFRAGQLVAMGVEKIDELVTHYATASAKPKATPKGDLN